MTASRKTLERSLQALTSKGRETEQKTLTAHSKHVRKDIIMTVKYQIAYYGKNHYRIWDNSIKDFIDCHLRMYHTKFDTFAEAKKVADEIRNASPDMAESVCIEGIECYRDF